MSSINEIAAEILYWTRQQAQQRALLKEMTQKKRILEDQFAEYCKREQWPGCDVDGFRISVADKKSKKRPSREEVLHVLQTNGVRGAHVFVDKLLYKSPTSKEVVKIDKPKTRNSKNAIT